MKVSDLILKKIASVFALILLPFYSYAYDVSFSGGSKNVIDIDAEKNTGLDKIFVVYNSSEITGVEISGCVSSSPRVEKYSNLGGGYAIEVPVSYNSGVVGMSGIEGNTGYILTDGDNRFCFWVVDYQPYIFSITGLSMDAEQECGSSRIRVEGNASPVHYYTIDGRQKVLSREIMLEYTTLVWDEENLNFVSKDISESLESFSEVITIMPPLYCNTEIVVSGDRFLKKWGMERNVSSSMIQPNGVDVRSRALQTNSNEEDSESGSNMIKVETEGLGGSAPADITFYGYITDAVLHTEWQMASDPEFEYILYRFNEQDVSYTFTEEGQFYMRFIGSNSDGSCEAIGETYTVAIGASDLRIPNAFSPNGDGVNDEWKVGYRSLLDFKCWIFDSKGNQMFHFTDPSKGWDGKYRGKVVAPGVYYYVIEARGADGKKYKKGGDINIINFKRRGSSTGDNAE